MIRITVSTKLHEFETVYQLVPRSDSRGISSLLNFSMCVHCTHTMGLSGQFSLCISGVSHINNLTVNLMYKNHYKNQWKVLLFEYSKLIV